MAKRLAVRPLGVRGLASHLAGKVLRVIGGEDVREQVLRAGDEPVRLFAARLALPGLHGEDDARAAAGHRRAAEVVQRLLQHFLVLPVVRQEHDVQYVVRCRVLVLELLQQGVPVDVAVLPHVIGAPSAADREVRDPEHDHECERCSDKVKQPSGKHRGKDHKTVQPEQRQRRCHAAEPWQHLDLRKAHPAPPPGGDVPAP
mmetsp:Transcript_129171/g.373922  ORF Transcript_129171/g.373922 Transcript_129171/m.373922 type:complete len:201 (+) Transcript_129171:802-1404(+)